MISLTDLLKQSARFLDGDHSSAPGATLSAALLAREALERAIESWASNALRMKLKGVSGRSKLSVLDGYLGDRELSARARFVWHSLSSATHHSSAGPGRAPSEVRDLAVQVEHVIRGLSLDAQRRRGTNSGARQS